MSNYWFIYDTIPTTYPQQLNYTTGDGTVGHYEVTEDHAVSLRATTIFTKNETLIFNLIDIGSAYNTGTYQKIITYIKKIIVDVNIVLFVGSDNYGTSFDLSSFEHILSFTIRQNTNTNRTSTESLNFNNCSNLTSIIPDKLLVSQLTANDCPKLTGNLDLQYCSNSLTIVNAGYTTMPQVLAGITSLTFSSTQPITTIYVPYTSITNLSLNTAMHTSLLTINVNGCSKLKNDAGDGTQNPLDLSAFTSLSTFNANNTLYESIKFGTGISTINMQNCSNLSEISFSTSQISTLNLLNCTLLQSIPNLTTTNFSPTPIINLSGTDIDSIILDSLDSTNITYPETMQSLNITNSSQSGTLNLSTFSSLSSISLSTCNSLTGFNIGSSVKTINLNNCTSMTGSYTIPSTLTSCSFTNCGFTGIISNGSSITKIDLQNLPYCKSISISNTTSAASIFIGGTTSGTFVISNSTFNLESLTLSNCQIPSMTLSATEKILTFKTLNLSSSSCSSVTIPLNYFTNISTINFNNCANLNTFNGEQKFVITANDVLNTIDLSGSKLNYIDVHGSYNIQNITFPTTATNIDISGLSKISEFNISDYTNLKYLNISNTNINTISGTRSTATPEIGIRATHKSFQSINLVNYNLGILGFSTATDSQFTSFLCTSCSFTGNTLDLSTYSTLTNVSLNSCQLQSLTIGSNVNSLTAQQNPFVTVYLGDITTSNINTINLNNCQQFTGFNNESNISTTNLPISVSELYLNNTAITSINLNNTYTNLLTLAPPTSIQSIIIPRISTLSGFYINDTLTNNITNLTNLNTLDISNTGFVQLIGTGTNNHKLASVNANGISNIELTGYNTLSSLEVSNISNLNINNCSSFNGSGGTFTIPNIAENGSINIEGTAISNLIIQSETSATISNLALSTSTSSLELTNIGYQNQLPITNYLTNLTLNNCLIEMISSSIDHSNVFSLYVNGGIFKNFDIGNFADIRNLQLQNISGFAFLMNGQSTSNIGGDKWNTTEIFDISTDISELQIDLSGNNQKISKFNITSNNLNNLSVTGWNPNPSATINFSTDNLSTLSLIDSKVDITPPVSFKEMSNLQMLNITGSNFTSLDFKYTTENNTLENITATSSTINSISLANTNALNTLYLDGTNITSLDYAGTLDNPKTLEYISLPNKLLSLKLAYCTSLTTQIDPSEMTLLKKFIIPNCKQTGDQTGNIKFNSSSLSEVDLSLNAIQSVKLSGPITSLNLENTSISTDFSSSTDPQYYGMNTSSLSTLKLAGTQITKISIPYGSYNQGTMGEIKDLSLPSNCNYLNISNQTAIRDKSDPDNIKDLSAILGSCKNLNTLNANNCGLSGKLVIESPLSEISLQGNSGLSTFDLSNYNALTSFNLSGTSIANININSNETITNAAMPTSTQTITFTKAKFAESLQTRTFKNASNLTSLSLINTNIRELTCDSCPKLNSINLTPIAKTRQIIENDSLTTLTIDTCDNLPILQINNCTALTTASISSCSILESLYLNNCPVLTSLSIEELSNLLIFELINCNIFTGNDVFTSNIISNLPNLTSLKLTNTRIQDLTINNSSKFITLTGSLKGTNADGNEIGLINLDLNGCINFNGLTDNNSDPTSFALATPYLENLNISNTIVSNIDCHDITSLANLSLSSSSININVSGCSNLIDLDISNCSNLESLNGSNSAIQNLTTSTIDQSSLTNINMSGSSISSINLDNYSSLSSIDLSYTDISLYNIYPSTLISLNLGETKVSTLNIPNLDELSTLNLNNCNLSNLSINGCKKLNNDYLQDLSITDSATFNNLGIFVPQSISAINPSSIIITKTDWQVFELNGELLNNSENSIDIKLNDKLTSLSFTNIPSSPIYRNLDISFNNILKSINNKTDIFDICDLLNVNLISFNDISNYDKLNINLTMNEFTSDDSPELPQYLGIYPQITEWDGTSGKLLGEINFIPASTDTATIGEFIGLHQDIINIDNLLQFSFNNISVWDAGTYQTNEDINTLSFGNILSIYIADIDGDVPDDSVHISVNGNDMRLIEIIESMFERGMKPDRIYTNSDLLKTLANEYNIPVQILHTRTENWNPTYPYPNIFKIQLII